MYAVIKTGGKQYRVSEGDRLDVELMSGVADTKSGKAELKPILVVDGSNVLASASELANATVSARVVGETKGKKIRGFIYKNKTNSRRHWGHRQKYSILEITGITGAKSSSKAPAKAKTETAKPADSAAENEK